MGASLQWLQRGSFEPFILPPLGCSCFQRFILHASPISASHPYTKVAPGRSVYKRWNSFGQRSRPMNMPPFEFLWVEGGWDCLLIECRFALRHISCTDFILLACLFHVVDCLHVTLWTCLFCWCWLCFARSPTRTHEQAQTVRKRARFAGQAENLPSRAIYLQF